MFSGPSPEAPRRVTLFDADPRLALKAYFGFEAFRPLQEEIVGDVLAGRDAFALLPTGGGKSLCYQLPAVMRPGLSLVVSPLIALMKDQVDALITAGIPATYLSSSLEPDELRRRIRGLHAGDYRLLYLAPERLTLPHVTRELASWNVGRIAVDEAHCISEWGHDFRPDYRRLAELRESLGDIPVLALTATATERVRRDIIQLLRLREPRCYVAGFDRPNLLYRVVPKEDAYRKLLAFVRERSRESGIVYVASRRQAETLASRLRDDGISAAPYHAGLEPRERTRNQERFVRDDVNVICATIAFGMGIDKANVRYVVHYDLPKNIEGYYQETGRAGRDGLAAECLLFFSGGDVAKQLGFIEEKDDERDRRLTLEQLRRLIDYAESGVCRRIALLGYFGESPSGNCGNCDNCLSPREQFDGTILAQKFMACVFRVRQASGFGVGLHHIVDVLLGRETEKVRAWGHDRLSTYRLGSDLPRAQWLAVGRELVRAGFLRQTPGLRSTLELTKAGVAALSDRRTVMLSSAPATDSRSLGASTAADERLFEALRALRKRLADARDVPAYVIFSDATLRAMSTMRPTDQREMRSIPGVGEKKLADFGDVFLAEIAAVLGETEAAAT
jgi:ATP-dependent DNA helicase RecQ